MKTSFLLLAATLTAGYCNARSGKTINAFHYKVDNTSYFEVKDGVPGSDIAFYSERHGGKLVREAILNETGGWKIQTEEPFAPAFVLNLQAKNQKGVSGSGMVFFMEENEFTLSGMKAEATNNAVTVGWNAATDPAQKISFEIMKSYDGLSYFKVADINAYSTGIASDYAFTEAKGVAGTYYKINVNNSKEGARYTSYPLAFQSNDVINVYPTVTRSNINVVLLQDADSKYTITNTLGQTVGNGDLVKGINKLSVTELPAGIYMVNVNGGVRNYSVKFVKE
jgi:hypothetical protein